MIRYLNGYFLFPLLEKKTERDIFSKYKELKKFEKLAKTEANEIQKREFHKVLLFCKKNVPYYQDLFKAHSFDVDKIKKDLRYIQDIPVLTKELIREHSARIVCDGAVHPRKTGGSTGQSVHFHYNNTGLDWTSAINLLAYDMAKNYRHRKDCHISSELGMPQPDFKGRCLDWLKLFSQNRKRLMISSFSDVDLKQTFQDLKSIKPFLVQGHPSSMYALANYIKNLNIKQAKYFSVFEPSGEMLSPKIVSAIETHLGAKVVNRYGNAEFGVMAHSKYDDPYTKLKIFNRAFYFEETNASNLIGTNFTNYGMPLLRYDTGDIGTVKHEDDGSYIYDIQGRVHDAVSIDGDDYATHFIMDYLDHKIRDIREFQIIVDGSNAPLLNIVPENAEDSERIRKELMLRWPVGLDVAFIKHEELQTVGWRQKFRHVINKRDSIDE